jgi:hypothetical protein
MKGQDKKTSYIAEEIFVIEHSGEIPEVTFHESLYYLAEDPEGPGLQLTPDDVYRLKQAVLLRYRAIIQRDLDHNNRDKRIYRGLTRCITNWQRLEGFCTREQIDFTSLRVETGEALQKFLKHEKADVESGKRSSCINCSCRDIKNLALSLGILPGDMPKGWQELCHEEVKSENNG